MEWEEGELMDLLMEWEENTDNVERIVEDMEVELEEDWPMFMEDQDEIEYEMWMITELENLGINWNEVVEEVADMEIEDRDV